MGNKNKSKDPSGNTGISVRVGGHTLCRMTANLADGYLVCFAGTECL